MSAFLGIKIENTLFLIAAKTSILIPTRGGACPVLIAEIALQEAALSVNFLSIGLRDNNQTNWR